MSERITIEELESYLWNSAVLLRSSIDAGAYKQYIFPLLFFKRICDVYDEETAAAVEEYGEDVADFDEDELHAFIVPEGHHWKDVREVCENVGTAVVNAFHAIEKANIEQLHGVFGDGAWTNKNRLPDSLLKDLIEHFSSKTLSIANCPEDELGQGYEYLIKKFADDSGHTAQEFYTNRTVVHLMTEILKPQSGESVYDPTCGSAGMLISCIAYLKEHGQEWRNLKVYGQEINQLTSAIGRMNLFLHGVQTFEIANDDTLRNPAFVENGKLKTFDIVLANPPYSIKQWDRDAFASDKYGRNFLGTPPQDRADYAFIQHILKSMDCETGRCAVLLPHGVLNRKEEAGIRRNIVKTDCIEAVIGLGRHLFYNSGLESCVLVCNMNKSARRRDHVLFVEAEKCVHKKKNQNYLFDEDIAKIMEAYHSDEDIEGFSKHVSIKDILENEGNLNIKLYVKNQESVTVAEEDMIQLIEDYFECASRAHDAINAIPNCNPEMESYEAEINSDFRLNKSKWEKVKLGDIAEEYSERIGNPSESEYEWYIGSDCIDGYDFRITRRSPASKVKSAQKLFKAGDYLLVRRSLYGSDFRERAPKAEFNGVCSADILTIREKKGAVEEGYLIKVLYSKALWDFIVANSTGSLTRRIKWKQLKDFEFELPPKDIQRKMADTLWAMYAAKKAYQNLIIKTDELVKAQFIEMFGDIPKEQHRTIKDVCHIVTDGTHQPPKFVSEGIPFLLVSNIANNEVTYKTSKFITEETYNELIKRTPIEIGDILLSTVGSYGHPAIVKCDKKFCFQRHIAYLKPNNEIIDSVFLYATLLSHEVQSQIDNLVLGVAQKTLNLSAIRSIEIPIPPMEQQKTFCKVFEQAGQSKSALQQAVEKIDSLMKSLIQQDFSCE